MALELGRIPVEDVEWAPRTAIDGMVFQINREELIAKTR
jgi:hypothetical protein